MDMPLNTFKRALAAGESQIGLFLGTGSPWIAEIVATCGYDWLLIDGEHGPNDLHSIIAQLQVLAAYPARAVVRLPDHDVARIKQVLDAGAQTLMIPMVESAAQAQTLVRAMRYPPGGMRGVGTAMARAARWNGVGDYFKHADAEMCLIAQIESLVGLAALEGIVGVEGVDAVFVGPSDLAAAMGYPGQPGHPEVKAAVEGALRAIVAAGKAAGVFSADPATAQAYRQSGASFLLVGVDAPLLRQAGDQLLARFRSARSACVAAY